MKGLFLLLVAVLGLAAYVRLAPSDPARWHRAVGAVQDRDLDGGVIRVIAAQQPGDLLRLDQIARGWPGTSLLAGSAEEGHVTYVTRSKLWGFPDYTTVELVGAQLRIHARLRFGRSDLGVNGKRVAAWLAALRQG